MNRPSPSEGGAARIPTLGAVANRRRRGILALLAGRASPVAEAGRPTRLAATEREEYEGARGERRPAEIPRPTRTNGVPSTEGTRNR